jgi:phosphoribosylanthranilate isomerase
MNQEKSLPFQIKICGLTRPADANSALQAGADAVGLNYYRHSSRFVGDEQADLIVQEVMRSKRAKFDTRPCLVGVFVNARLDAILDKIVRHQLSAVQFHGDEEPSEMFQLQQQLKLNPLTGTGSKEISFIRALRINRQPHDPRGHVLNLDQIVHQSRPWIEAGVSAILLDAASASQYGGTGLTLDWAAVSQIDLGVPIILAGGLNPMNIAEAIRISKVRAVDVASGVESAIGIKDEHLLRLFVRNTGWITNRLYDI